MKQLVIIDDFNVVRVPVTPNKTKPPLVVDSNAVLPFPVAMQRFETVSRWRSKITQLGCTIQLPELSSGNSLDRSKASAG